jgi:hypothetical protein
VAAAGVQAQAQRGASCERKGGGGESVLLCVCCHADSALLLLLRGTPAQRIRGAAL